MKMIDYWAHSLGHLDTLQTLLPVPLIRMRAVGELTSKRSARELDVQLELPTVSFLGTEAALGEAFREEAIELIRSPEAKLILRNLPVPSKESPEWDRLSREAPPLNQCARDLWVATSNFLEENLEIREFARLDKSLELLSASTVYVMHELALLPPGVPAAGKASPRWRIKFIGSLYTVGAEDVLRGPLVEMRTPSEFEMGPSAVSGTEFEDAVRNLHALLAASIRYCVQRSADSPPAEQKAPTQPKKEEVEEWQI